MKTGEGIKAVMNAAANAGQKLNQSKGAHDLTNWIAHGATELANIAVHGHPAPMYASNVSPPDVPNVNDVRIDSQNVQHSGMTPGQQKMQEAEQRMQARMNAPSPQQTQEMSR